ncbi:MAG: outer membrane beta-barrel protein [Prevotella sp.]|nr:outer membrane beta-barrel protein [Prevotella sp.]
MKWFESISSKDSRSSSRRGGRSVCGLLLLFMLSAPVPTLAQADEEYLLEVGGGIGAVSYLGDFNGSISGNMQPLATALLRRVINPYMGVTATVSYGQLKGSYKSAGTFYPDYQGQTYSFSNPLVDLSLRYEYNFWPYGTGRDYRGAKRLTPFVFGGLGGTYTNTTGTVLATNLLLGAGVKYKAAKRLNVALEWGIHFTTSDKLDGAEDPYYIKSTGAFKNKDCYSALQLTLTYSFLAKCRTCHNEDE